MAVWNVWSLIFFAVFVLSVQGHARVHFSPSEFPNYFVPSEFRDWSPERLRNERPDVIKSSRTSVEKALDTIFERLSIPVVMPGQDKPTSKRFLPELDRQLALRFPGKKIEFGPSAGVIRASYSFLYTVVDEGEAKGIPASETLRKIAAADHPVFTKTGNLPGHLVRGVGSDMDLIIRSVDPSDYSEVARFVSDFTNSAETSAGLRYEATSAKSAFYPPADVKPYDDVLLPDGTTIAQGQFRRSTNQGGSTIDLLYFDRKAGRLIEPDSYLPGQDIVNKMISGQYDYLPPKLGADGAEIVEDAAKQTIRGIRPLVELPHMELRDPARFRSELSDLIAKVRSGELGPADLRKSLEQFTKMSRNSIRSAASNRLRRGAPDSIEALIGNALEIIEAKTGVGTVPEFTEDLPIGRAPPMEGVPLMSPADFRKKHTARGNLFHGTPSIEHSLSILRGNLVVSTQGGKIGTSTTTAAFGRGAYATSKESVSSAFAKSEGVVLKLQMADNPNLRILDWDGEGVQNSPLILRVRERAAKAVEGTGKSALDETFRILSREYGVDIIVHNHVLIQNSRAVKKPKGLRELLYAYESRVNNPSVPLKQRVRAYRIGQKMRATVRAGGETPPRGPSKRKLASDLKKAAKESRDLDLLKDLPEALREFRAPRADKLLIARIIQEMRADSLQSLTTFQRKDKFSQKLIEAVGPELNLRGSRALPVLIELAKVDDTAKSDLNRLVDDMVAGKKKSHVSALADLVAESGARVITGSSKPKELAIAILTDPGLKQKKNAVSIVRTIVEDVAIPAEVFNEPKVQKSVGRVFAHSQADLDEVAQIFEDLDSVTDPKLRQLPLNRQELLYGAVLQVGDRNPNFYTRLLRQAGTTIRGNDNRVLSWLPEVVAKHPDRAKETLDFLRGFARAQSIIGESDTTLNAFRSMRKIFENGRTGLSVDDHASFIAEVSALQRAALPDAVKYEAVRKGAGGASWMSLSWMGQDAKPGWDIVHETSQVFLAEARSHPEVAIYLYNTLGHRYDETKVKSLATTAIQIADEYPEIMAAGRAKDKKRVRELIADRIRVKTGSKSERGKALRRILRDVNEYDYLVVRDPRLRKEAARRVAKKAAKQGLPAPDTKDARRVRSYLTAEGDEARQLINDVVDAVCVPSP